MNFTEPGLAFIEGLALIASPCILPVLPIVLASSVEGGRRRPFGIILGFVLAFTLFALTSRKLVAIFNIDLDIIKKASLVFLFLFGLILLSEWLSDKFSTFTSKAANLGSELEHNLSSKAERGGFKSGLIIGGLIGFIWTPCAGPVLAAVLVQVIRQQTDLEGLTIILCFAFGAGLPMLLIALMGRKIMSKLSFFSEHAEGVRKTFGIVIILAVAFMAVGLDPQLAFSSMKQEPSAALSLEDALAHPYQAPEFSGITAWLNSEPLTIAGLKGKVVLVDFWTYSCINCVRTLPHITEWDKKYRENGLVIIGIHAPEFEFEKKIENVKTALVKYGIHYPVALDNDLDTWGRFNNRYWPAHYLIDQSGKVVYSHFGEGHYAETENNIRFLLGLKDKAARDESPAQPSNSYRQTPETYLGYVRAERYEGTPSLMPDARVRYHFPKFLADDSWALSGGWAVEGQRIVSTEAGASLQLNFHARKVFLVLGTQTAKPVKVTLFINGEPVVESAGKDAPGGTLTVDHNTLYELIDQQTAKNGLLEIRAEEPGLEAYAFTFGG